MNAPDGTSGATFLVTVWITVRGGVRLVTVIVLVMTLGFDFTTFVEVCAGVVDECVTGGVVVFAGGGVFAGGEAVLPTSAPAPAAAPEFFCVAS